MSSAAITSVLLGREPASRTARNEENAVDCFARFDSRVMTAKSDNRDRSQREVGTGQRSPAHCCARSLPALTGRHADAVCTKHSHTWTRLLGHVPGGDARAQSLDLQSFDAGAKCLPIRAAASLRQATTPGNLLVFFISVGGRIPVLGAIFVSITRSAMEAYGNWIAGGFVLWAVIRGWILTQRRLHSITARIFYDDDPAPGGIDFHGGPPG